MKLYIEDNEDIPASKVLKDSDAAPVGYTDCSQDLIKWKLWGMNDCSDYLQFREYVQQQLDIKTWVNLSNDERDFVIELSIQESSIDSSTDGVNKVTHIITTGKTDSDPSLARTYLIKKWAEHHIKQKVVPGMRLNSHRLYEIVGNYLSHDDAARFFISVENLFSAYESQVIRGSQDGLDIDALFDYIESTAGSVYENAGLDAKGYVMQNGDTDSVNFSADLMDVLRNGNY